MVMCVADSLEDSLVLTRDLWRRLVAAHRVLLECGGFFRVVNDSRAGPAYTMIGSLSLYSGVLLCVTQILLLQDDEMGQRYRCRSGRW
jgi:hypothetical protein